MMNLTVTGLNVKMRSQRDQVDCELSWRSWRNEDSGARVGLRLCTDYTVTLTGADGGASQPATSQVRAGTVIAPVAFALSFCFSRLCFMRLE